MLGSIGEAAQAFRAGSLSPADLARECLDRIERENPRINAFYEVFRAGALAEAARAGEELRAGRDRGPLHGIPVGVKDLFDVAGSVTTSGAHPGFHPPPAARDAEVVARLRRAGAVVLGKTSLHEWAFGVSSNNPHFGPSRNPHDPARIPGGSSGGSAAALSAGLCLGALGTDTGGSIRIPASLCGVAGLKPGFGVVPTAGLMPLAPSLDHAGPMARTVDDVFTLLAGISDWKPRETAVPRVLAPVGPFFEVVDPPVRDLVRAATARLGPATEVELPGIEEAWRANTTILVSEGAMTHEARLQEHPERFGALLERFTPARGWTAVDYAKARRVQRDWAAALSSLLGDHSVLALPSTACPATPIGDPEGPPLSKIMTRYTAPFNLAGVPCLSVPAGKAGGLPVGVQLVAGFGQEALLRTAGRLVVS